MAISGRHHISLAISPTEDDKKEKHFKGKPVIRTKTPTQRKEGIDYINLRHAFGGQNDPTCMFTSVILCNMETKHPVVTFPKTYFLSE